MIALLKVYYGGFYNNFSFEEDERAHFQGRTGRSILIAVLEFVMWRVLDNFLLRRRNRLIFKEEPGHFTQNPVGFYNNFSFKEGVNGLIFKEKPGHFTLNPGWLYNNFSFKEEEWAHFQGGTGPLYPKPTRVLQ